MECQLDSAGYRKVSNRGSESPLEESQFAEAHNAPRGKQTLGQCMLARMVVARWLSIDASPFLLHPACFG